MALAVCPFWAVWAKQEEPGPKTWTMTRALRFSATRIVVDTHVWHLTNFKKDPLACPPRDSQKCSQGLVPRIVKGKRRAKVMGGKVIAELFLYARNYPGRLRNEGAIIIGGRDVHRHLFRKGGFACCWAISKGDWI